MVRILSVVLFVTGMILMLVLTILALWPDLEAALFDTTHSGGESLNALRCPLLITPSEETAIRLTLTNPLDRPVNFLARARIAEGYVTLMRQENAEMMVAPGGSAEFVWPVTAEDAVYDRMILARVRVLRSSTLPARQKACGIYVLPVPGLRGNQVVAGLLAATFLSLGLGGVLWVWNERRLRQSPLTGRTRELTRIVGLFALLLLITMIASLLGWWGGGVIIILVMVLVLAAMLERWQ